MRFVILLPLVLFLPALAFSSTYYVPDDYGTIQLAINSVSNGDTVIVKPGTYLENINFYGKAITVTSEQGPDATVIDGGNSGIVVTFDNNEGSSSRIDGFTITNGNGSFGGGVRCWETSPTISNNVITQNTASSAGAGIDCNYGSPSISGNIITDNFCTYQGVGVNCYRANPTIDNNVISYNTSQDGAGGGIMCYMEAHVVITNNIITGNVAQTGAGISCTGDCNVTIKNNVISYNAADTHYAGGIRGHSGSHLDIVNNLIYGNSASNGGGVELFTDTTANITNNTIFGNSASTQGGGLHVYYKNCHAVIKNTIFWGNDSPLGPAILIKGTSTVTIDYSDLEGGQTSVEVESGCTLNWGASMIDADPLFVDSANDDLHLTYTSPCRGIGDNSSVSEPNDIEGDPRIAYGIVDMGADEFYTHLYWTGDATPGGSAALKFVGLPGSPVHLWLGSGIIDPPTPTIYGDWYLQFPLLADVALGNLPSSGVMVLPFILPVTAPTPLSLPFQAGIGMQLTNLSEMAVK